MQILKTAWKKKLEFRIKSRVRLYMQIILLASILTTEEGPISAFNKTAAIKQMQVESKGCKTLMIEFFFFV